MNAPDTSAARFDIHQAITDQIVALIEKGAGDFQMPWHQSGGALHMPVNIASGKPYQGINVVMLWGSAQVRGYRQPVWGTFKQWLEKGCPVRKGEKATPGVFYKDLIVPSNSGEGADSMRKVPMARAFWLFNAAQVEGYTPPELALPDPATIDPIASADTLLKSSGSVIVEGGDQAFYQPSTDKIHLPSRTLFRDTSTSSATQGFYAVALHESVHWTGAKHRLDRNLADRFKLASVAMEELVAELGSAMLCADLGVSPQPRLDHAQYVANWLEGLRSDKKAIFTAASAAHKAVEYLHGFAPPRPDLAPHPIDNVMEPL